MSSFIYFKIVSGSSELTDSGNVTSLFQIAPAREVVEVGLRVF